ESINISGGAYWPTMWMAYFLMHKKLYLENENYYATSELVGEYDLKDNANVVSQIVHVKPAATPPITRLNERFTLFGPSRKKVSAKLGVGWHLGEIGHVWSGKNGKVSSIIIHSQDDGVKVVL